MNTIKSPITNSNNIQLVKKINSQFIIDAYIKNFNIDVKSYFEKNNEIFLYKCMDTGYKFFYPIIEGDGNFYSKLQIFPWYYSDWKWENQQSLKFINIEDKVLDVGSGKGLFLKHLKNRGIEVYGLETNQDAAKECISLGVPVYEENLNSFVSKNIINNFDVICFFQVLEHIYDVSSNIKDAISILKVGGKLIISVPNNSSFIKDDKNGYLNMPPHHVGLWDEESLLSLGKIFNLKLISLELEPLQRHHYSYYYNIKIGYKIKEKFGFLGKIFNRVIVFILFPIFFILRNKIKGHTIMAIYQKTI